MDDKSIKSNIRKLREQLHLTQEEMAERLGMSVSNYVCIESGKTRLLSRNLGIIADASGVSTEELVLGFTPQEVPQTLREAEQKYETREKALVSDYEEQIRLLRESLKAKEDMLETQRTAIRSLEALVAILQNRLSQDK